MSISLVIVRTLFELRILDRLNIELGFLFKKLSFEDNERKSIIPIDVLICFKPVRQSKGLVYLLLRTL